MARILIYGTEETVTRKLEQVFTKERCVVKACEASEKLPAPIDEPTLVVLDARLKWTVCRPLFIDIQMAGYPVLFLTADREMTSHLRALYCGQSDVLMLPFSPKAAVVKALFHGSLRVDEADEALGLDASQHGESAYPSFSGLD